MKSMQIRNPQTNEWEPVYLPPTGDTLPVGSIVDYDGDVVPTNYEQVEDPNEYSTNEVKTNKTWLGKPVYRKVYYVSALKNDEITIILHEIADLGDVVTARGIGRSSANQQYPIPFVGNDAMFSGTTITLRVTATEIVIADKIGGATDLTKHSAYIIMEYTKTSDTVEEV